MGNVARLAEPIPLRSHIIPFPSRSLDISLASTLDPRSPPGDPIHRLWIKLFHHLGNLATPNMIPYSKFVGGATIICRAEVCFPCCQHLVPSQIGYPQIVMAASVIWPLGAKQAYDRCRSVQAEERLPITPSGPPSGSTSGSVKTPVERVGRSSDN